MSKSSYSDSSSDSFTLNSRSRLIYPWIKWPNVVITLNISSLVPYCAFLRVSTIISSLIKYLGRRRCGKKRADLVMVFCFVMSSKTFVRKSYNVGWWFNDLHAIKMMQSKFPRKSFSENNWYRPKNVSVLLPLHCSYVQQKTRPFRGHSKSLWGNEDFWRLEFPILECLTSLIMQRMIHVNFE